MALKPHFLRLGSLLYLSACLTAGYGCATHVPGPKETFDESSGTTLIVVQHPIVLARSRTDVAANMRDYVTLVVAKEDRSGKYSTWLIAYRWSTVDARFDAMRVAESGTLLLVGDARSITLSPAKQPPAFLRRGDLLFAPHFALDTWAYPVDLPTLRYLAAARELSLRLQGDPLPVAYSIWEDGRSELLSLLAGAPR